MSQLPPNLPDERTAQRLLDILSQLEHAVKNARSAPQAEAPSVASTIRLTQLQTENTSLRRRQQEARQRLESLISKLEVAPEQVAGKDEEEKEQAA